MGECEAPASQRKTETETKTQSKGAEAGRGLLPGVRLGGGAVLRGDPASAVRGLLGGRPAAVVGQRPVSGALGGHAPREDYGGVGRLNGQTPPTCAGPARQATRPGAQDSFGMRDGGWGGQDNRIDGMKEETGERKDRRPKTLSPSSPSSCNPVQPPPFLSDALIRRVQGLLALGRVTARQIARRYGLPLRTVLNVQRGKIRATGQAGRFDAVRKLEAWRELLLEPLGVLVEPEPPEPGEEDLDMQGASKAYHKVRRAKLLARRRNRVLRGS